MQYFAFVTRRDQLMGPGESKNEENISGSDSNSVFFWAYLKIMQCVLINWRYPKLKQQNKKVRLS